MGLAFVIEQDLRMFGPAISHVTIGTWDLATTASALESQGLTGERYPGGACFPVGPLQYIEIQVADPDGRPLQQWIASVVERSARWCGWAVAVPDLEVIQGHDLASVDVDQRRAGEGFAPWAFTVAGGDRMRSSRGVCPYFIRYWHGPEEHAAILRRRAGGAVPRALGGFVELGVIDPERELESWLAPVGGIPAAATLGGEVAAITQVSVLHNGAPRLVEVA